MYYSATSDDAITNYDLLHFGKLINKWFILQNIAVHNKISTFTALSERML